MPFVVKVSGPTGEAGWLAPLNHNDVRTLVTREAAELFNASEGARLAIGSMPAALRNAGIAFSVEPVA